MINKNKTIKIFNTEYKVKFVDKPEPIDEGNFCYGCTDSSTLSIVIALKDPTGKNLKKNTLDITLLHELIHAILNEGLYLLASKDEPMVEWLAKCIKHLLDQKVIS